MMLVVTFKGDDTFVQMIDTNLLAADQKAAAEAAVDGAAKCGELFGADFFSGLQAGFVLPASALPCAVDGFLDVHLD